MIDTALLETYADICVKTGVNLRQGQCLLINTPVGAYGFARLIANRAYRHGAKFVRINVVDNHLIRSRLEHGRPDDFDWLPNYLLSESYEYLAQDWARIRIDSSEEMEVLSAVDPAALARVQTAQRSLLRRQQEALMGNQHAWLVIAAPGPNWARWVFRHSGPELAAKAEKLDDEAVTDLLWESIKPILRLDRPDPVAATAQHLAALRDRCRKLDSLRLDGVRFVAKGTDLFIGLTPESRWCGADSTLPDGRPFMANIPTEEVFTTPDYRRTHGKVRVSRPVSVMENLVHEAWFEFEDGRVVRSGAREGGEILQKFLAMDEGAGCLGEVALVAGDSPIFQSGLLFGSILYDENASCHIALGAGYSSCMANAAQLNTAALQKAAGCNVSMVHTDFMVGTPETDVFGILADGRQVPIIRQGSFVI
jgi:aminopeptidase